MSRKLWWRLSLGALIVLGMGLVYSYSQETRYREQAEAFDLMKDVYQTILYRYYRDVSPQEFVNTAIQAVIDRELDPHTHYYKDKKAFANLKIHTEGEYGGLGIRVNMQDGRLTVISPMVNTPAARAGILSGDQIIRIDGKSAEGRNQDSLVDELRGDINSEVTLTIQRGDDEVFDTRLIRERIMVPSVPYYGVTQGIGYIQMSEFSKKTRHDLAEAIRQVEQQHPDGLILDLRNNPGGLLQQAVDVVSLFVGPDKKVVSTKNRSRDMYNEWKTEDPMVYSGKLAVLVNRGSASASEIVAGALQDYDRCVIIGTKTFGKGSVQNLIPIDNQGRMLKLTTSHYYIPSGRCIHRFSPAKSSSRSASLSQDSVAERISRSQDQVSYLNYEDSIFSEKIKQQTFYTSSGREVTAGDGIEPDIEVVDSTLSPISVFLTRHQAFFKFMIHYRKNHSIRDYSQIGTETLNVFAEWCSRKQELRYQSPAEKELQQLDVAIQKEGLQAELGRDIEDIRLKLRHDCPELIQRNSQEIIDLLQQQWISQNQADSFLYQLQFRKDPAIVKAIAVLKNQDDYEKILAGK
ncbi:MAG: S41 family peptidase [Candidatus Delongbacteria bacterium]|nr:S41 family peptidase [Candidatus Delongbacteria bacterium]